MSKSVTHKDGSAVKEMISVVDLLDHPDLARIYSYLMKEDPKTVKEISEELDIPQGSAYDYVDELLESGVIVKTNEKRPYRYESVPIELTLTSTEDSQKKEYTVTPKLIDAVSRRGEVDDIDVYIQHHGIDGLATALEYAKDYVDGEMNHRIMAREHDLSPLEAEIILQELRHVILDYREKDE